MEPTDITVEILKDIREEMRRSNRVNEDQVSTLKADMATRFDVVDQRFEVIETALRDLSEQMVMHSRALRTLLDRSDTRSTTMADFERRLTALESARLG